MRLAVMRNGSTGHTRKECPGAVAGTWRLGCEEKAWDFDCMLLSLRGSMYGQAGAEGGVCQVHGTDTAVPDRFEDRGARSGNAWS